MNLLIAQIAALGVLRITHVIVEKQMHPQCVTVWCGFWAGGIIGPYFIENEPKAVDLFFLRVVRTLLQTWRQI